MASNLRFILYATKCDALVFRPIACAMDLPNEVLPTPGGPTKHRIDAPPMGFRIKYGQLFKDARFGFVKAMMLGVQQ